MNDSELCLADPVGNQCWVQGGLDLPFCRKNDFFSLFFPDYKGWIPIFGTEDPFLGFFRGWTLLFEISVSVPEIFLVIVPMKVIHFVIKGRLIIL